MNDTTIIPKHHCPYCNYEMDRATEAFGNAKPKGEDYSMCLNCGRIGIFNADLTIRQANPQEQEAINTHPDITRAQITRAYVVNKDLRP